MDHLFSKSGKSIIKCFIDTKKVTKSHIPTVNTPTRIDVHKGQLANKTKIRLKRERPIGS